MDSTNLKTELMNYMWETDALGHSINKPIDKWNHCFTGDTLIMTDRGLVRIDSIVPMKDKALTSKGFRKITTLFDNGCRMIYDYIIETDHGIVNIKATPDHKVKTINNNKVVWKELSKLTAKDAIICCSTALDSIRTKYQDTGTVVDQRHTNTIICTDMCGNTSMGLSQKDMLFITSTITKTTITSKTSSYCQTKNMHRGTRQK